MKNPARRFKLWLSRRYRRFDAAAWLTLLNDRMAGACLALHFMFFLALPFSLIFYVSDRMLGGTSKPEMDGGRVLIRMPEEIWKGFFWFANFYGALCGVVIVVFALYQIWDKAFRTDPFLRSGIKAVMAVAVASGLPLKLVANHMMLIPAEDRVPIKIFEVIDITMIAFSPYISMSGPWFLSKFIITCPLLFAVLWLARHRVQTRSNKGASNGCA